MLILGIHGGMKRESDYDPVGHGLHDAAAALIYDGEVLAAVEEERLSRIKHTNCFPTRAIHECLKVAGVRMQEVDFIATNMSQYVANAIERHSFVEDAEYRMEPDGQLRLASILEEIFGVDVRGRIRFCNHHLAHAWSAFAPSSFEQSLILTIDGEGDRCSGMVLVGNGSGLTKLHQYSPSNSLGELYLQMIKFIGYGRFDEYKVMGLAPYGDPKVFAPLFAKCYSLLPDGDYILESTQTWLSNIVSAGLLKHARRKGQPFSQIHKDFAAALQETIESIVLHILRHYRQKTSQRNLCLAGGVAHNCTLNGKILYSGLFDNIFVQPAAHDAGGALGAAWMTYYKETVTPRRPKFRHVSFGADIGGDLDIGRKLGYWTKHLSFELVDNVAARAAKLLAQGAVIGWAQGRSEFGPRALGNRSILADPRPAENKTLINQMVKKRENYRPFAPSVIEERVGDYFEILPIQSKLPFMTIVLKVREEMRELLGAVTHIDGTARAQTVSKEDNPLYWELINQFGKITGVPILLNTSFNNNAEPIVDSLDDAITTFLTTDVKYLVAGNYIIEKKQGNGADEALLFLAPNIPDSRKLVKRKVLSGELGRGEVVYEIESSKSRDFGPRTITISAEMFSMLQFADGKKNWQALIKKAWGEPNIERLLTEIKELWSSRAIILRHPE